MSPGYHMIVVRSLLSRLALVGVLVLSLPGQAAETVTSGQPLDSLLRPSIKSARAARLLMTSVVAAGKRLVACGERGVVMLYTGTRHFRH